MTKVLILTVGLPRSGKSTWAVAAGHPIVSPDAIRRAIHGHAYLPEAESLVWTMAQYEVRALFLAGHDIVIFDATNTTRERRDAWKSTRWRRQYVTFNTDMETCIRRCSTPHENRPDLIPVIERMAKNYEPVGDDEWDEAIDA